MKINSRIYVPKLRRIKFVPFVFAIKVKNITMHFIINSKVSLCVGYDPWI